jgi:hypothetical protein
MYMLLLVFYGNQRVTSGLFTGNRAGCPQWQATTAEQAQAVTASP